MTSPPLTIREHAYFKVTGPGAHEAITKLIGFKPSEAWNIGDISSRDGKPRKHMRWILSSDLDDTKPLREHIGTILLYLKPKTDTLRSLGLDYDLTLQCVGYFPASGHGAHFDREQIRQIAQLGLALDLDFYYVDDHEHEV